MGKLNCSRSLVVTAYYMRRCLEEPNDHLSVRSCARLFRGSWPPRPRPLRASCSGTPSCCPPGTLRT